MAELCCHPGAHGRIGGLSGACRLDGYRLSQTRSQPRRALAILHREVHRRSFQCFCLLDGVSHIPGARTLWAFKQRLAEGGLGARAIFDAVSQQLQQRRYIARGGQIVDASIVTAPTTRIKDDER